MQVRSVAVLSTFCAAPCQPEILQYFYCYQVLGNMEIFPSTILTGKVTEEQLTQKLSAGFLQLILTAFALLKNQCLCLPQLSKL